MKNLVIGLAMGFALATASAGGTDAEEILNARQEAAAWLAVLDAGTYGNSWDAASSFWKKDHTRQVTEKVLEEWRAPLGRLRERTLASSQYLPTPDGNCVHLQFRSRFESEEAVIETVELLREADGKWKVSLWAQRKAERRPIP